MEETDKINIGNINIYDNLSKDAIGDNTKYRAEKNTHLKQSQYVDDNIKCGILIKYVNDDSIKDKAEDKTNPEES